MKFLYADTQDYVDPAYDFINDRHAPNRERYWSDCYAHELMSPAPYDGLLVSMSGVRQARGVANSKVRYSIKEEQRLLRDGVRRFLRLHGPEHNNTMVMGDCGAFAYVEHETTAYTPTEVVGFYAEAEFTHGVSPDHIIFDYHADNPALDSLNESDRNRIRERYELTLENAAQFYRLSQSEGFPFEPIGALQGWSPESLASAAKCLEAIGYRYLAVGGLVPLKPEMIKRVIVEVRSAIKPETRLHLLGFAKAETIHEFKDVGIASFDSSSPMIRAFKDNRANFFLDGVSDGLEYFAAVRIPQAIENPLLVQGIKRGLFRAEDIQAEERNALAAVRGFDRGEVTLRKAISTVLSYHRFLVRAKTNDQDLQARALQKTEDALERTLSAAPWKRCNCEICRGAGVEVIIFRASNRNKRRGFHNLGAYFRHLKRVLERRP